MSRDWRWLGTTFFQKSVRLYVGGARFLMTSRDYIYNAARRDLKVSTFPLLDGSQVVIDVHQLTPEERRHILYNHLKLGMCAFKRWGVFLSLVEPD